MKNQFWQCGCSNSCKKFHRFKKLEIDVGKMPLDVLFRKREKNLLVHVYQKFQKEGVVFFESLLNYTAEQ